MSSDENWREVSKRRWEKSPLESMFALRIAIKFRDMYKEIFPRRGEYFFKEIKFFVGKQADDTDYTFGMDEEGRLLLGAIASTVAENIYSILAEYHKGVEDKARESARQYVKEVNPYLYQNIKRCSNCNFENSFSQKFCGQCGNKLPE
jgi:hypothetical protein